MAKRRPMAYPMPMEVPMVPRKTVAELERQGMWRDAQEEREYRAMNPGADSEMVPAYRYEERADWPESDMTPNSMGWGIKDEVRSPPGIRSFGAMMSNGTPPNTGHVYEEPMQGPAYNLRGKK